MKTRVVILFFSLIIAGGLICRGLAWLVFERGVERADVSLIKLAKRLDPWVSDYAYEEYVLTDDLAPLERAIRLEPTKPVYHMYYGLKLIDREPRTPESTQMAVTQICQGAELKPYSKTYRNACEEFRTATP